MPKVLRIINRFNLGGPTYNAAYLTKYMSSDFQTLLVGGVKDEAEGSSEYIVRNLGIEPVIIPEMRRSLNPANDLITYRKISKIIKKFKPDIVHTHASKAGTVGRLAAIRNKVPIIVHTFHGHVFHSYFGSSKTNFFINIEQGLANQCSKIVAISDKQKEELSETFKIAEPEKFEVIPLGFDLQRFQEDTEIRRKKFRAVYDLDDDEIAIGIIGRLAPVKNHKLFINAINKVEKNTGKKIRAFIVGDGELKEELFEQCRTLNLTYNHPNNGQVKKADVTFTSWIKDIETAYPGLDIIAMTSLNEGTPVSLIEAQAANKSIISTNVGGIENIVIPNRTATLTKNNCVIDFSDKLTELVNNEQLRRLYAENGWEHVKTKFHYTRLIADMENLYYKLLNQHN
ncbi:MAG: glycosyltransferase [Salinivirgaceae bacterium]|jgi:glycosyltransferase involved in cell wall biosynthesis|nr:glycosyltransferase [Salinivirgaceae bacterium]